MTTDLLTRARAGDDQAFRDLTDPYRRELLVHCYRVLGSFEDAEDAVQETLLSAWQGVGGFEERASVRTWLYRIATNRCLNARRSTLRRASRQAKEWEVPGIRPPEPTRLGEVVWLQPLPDNALDDPEARYEQQESISLAFVTALQLLPPRQVAVLVLRDVLGFPAKEVAEMLDTTPASVNSAMQRARVSVDDRLPERSQQATLATLGDDEIKALVERYVEAWNRGDVDAVVAMLAQDATFSMPPNFEWFRGREDIRDFLPTGPLSIPRIFVPTRANGQLAFGTYKLVDGEWVPNAIHVITLDAQGEITDMIAFLDPKLFARFGLPLVPQ